MERNFRSIINILALLLVVLLISNFLFIDSFSYGKEGPVLIDSRGLTFSPGMASDQIRLLKDFFRLRGDSNVPWGYAYDNRTRDLVRAYQKSKGLGSDGIAGPDTIRLINKDIINNNYRLGLRKPSTNYKKDLLVVNKGSNTLYFFKNGKIYKSYPLATGKTSQHTPNGKHKVVTKAKNPGWGGGRNGTPVPGGAPNNPLGKRWIGISYGGGSLYGIHGNSNPASIGKFVSLGCIRMFNHHVESLYEEVKIGTPVWIGNEDLLGQYGITFNMDYNDFNPEETNKDIDPAPEFIENESLSLVYNENIIKTASPVLNKNNYNFIPLRELVEVLGGKVIWYGDLSLAMAYIGDNRVEFQLDANKYKVNGETFKLEENQVTFINEKTLYVPLRNALEGLGFNIEWVEPTRSIIISDNLI